MSATHLVDLYLFDIPHFEYFSPEAIAIALSTLTSLEDLHLGSQSPQSLPDRATLRPPPVTRFVLPVLTDFEFKGVSKYLEDLVICIDAPQLERLKITFFNRILFDTSQLIPFISRASALKAEKVHAIFMDCSARVGLSSRASD